MIFECVGHLKRVILNELWNKKHLKQNGQNDDSSYMCVYILESFKDNSRKIKIPHIYILFIRIVSLSYYLFFPSNTLFQKLLLLP